ncbi:MULTISPECIES: hypothetical protein [Microvirga]|uniref:hypothetical protein n=1 Tax=Microvirga TaxID=186650 RepID=UPI0021C8D9D0|nr:MULTISPECIES: hypothetical protein [unclassified Microvirga]
MLPNPDYFHFGKTGIHYGLYGGLDYSGGVEGGKITGDNDPPPVDAYDKLFYAHDRDLQEATTTEDRLEAHANVVAGVYGLLTGTSPDWHIF